MAPPRKAKRIQVEALPWSRQLSHAQKLSNGDDLDAYQRALTELGRAVLAASEGSGAVSPRTVHWARGYHCAVAMALSEAGEVTTTVKSLFRQGGGVEHADEQDRALFRRHGLIK